MSRLGCQDNTFHNIYFVHNLVRKIRQSIIDDNPPKFKKDFLESILLNLLIIFS